jgi:hypothetical protein
MGMKYLTRVWTELPLVRPCKRTKITVPTTGIKFKGRYITYLIKAFGVNFSKGDFISLPNFAMGSLKFPDLSWRPSERIAVCLLTTKTPSNVSTKASWIRKVLESSVISVELSLRVRRIVVKAARGPLTKTSTASCGRYVKMNMKAMTPTDRVIVGANFERRGFHKVRWLTK